MPTKFDTSTHITQAIEDAKLLIAYAAQSGLTIDDATLSVLTDAPYRPYPAMWTKTQEADFWQAFNTITQRIKPGTIESVKAVSYVEGYTNGVTKIFTPAFRAVGFYIIVTIITMVFLLSTQIYLFAGMKLSQNIQQLNEQLDNLIRLGSARLGYSPERYQEEETSLRLQLATNRETLNLWIGVWMHLAGFVGSQGEIPLFDNDNYVANIQKLGTELKDAVAKKETVRDISIEETTVELGAMYQRKIDTLTQQLLQARREYDNAKNEYKQANIQLHAEYMLQVIHRYTLPLLYGLLGASAYVLRSLIRDIRNATYTRRSDMKYGVRLFLGAMAGPVIGFFILPEGTSGLGKLSPMAISFLAGYNIEILFAAMDWVVRSASQKNSPPKDQPASS